MKIFQYKTEQLLPIDINRAWSFFSAPRNLARITPSNLKFEILTDPCSDEIFEGMIIDYHVTPLPGLRMHWKTEICAVEKPGVFTDRQLKGPYSMWHHKHIFIEKGDQTLMKDEVNYQLPFGIMDSIVHSVVVRKRIEYIFNYRKQKIAEIFSIYAGNLN